VVDLVLQSIALYYSVLQRVAGELQSLNGGGGRGGGGGQPPLAFFGVGREVTGLESQRNISIYI